MRGISIPTGPPQTVPTQPPFTRQEGQLEQHSQVQRDQGSTPQLPHLALDPVFNHEGQTSTSSEQRRLIPIITERNGRGDTGPGIQGILQRPFLPLGPVDEVVPEQRTLLNEPVTASAISDAEPYHNGRKSVDSARVGTGSRPDSKLEHASVGPVNQRSGDGGSVRSFDPPGTTSAGFPDLERPNISPQLEQGPRVTGPRSNSLSATLGPVQPQNTSEKLVEDARTPQVESPVHSFSNDAAQLKSPDVESISPNPYTLQPSTQTAAALFPPSSSSAITLPSPYSMAGISSSQTIIFSPPPVQHPIQVSHPEPVPSAPDGDIINEAGALYYMQELQESTVPITTSNTPVPDSASDYSEFIPSSRQPISQSPQPAPLRSQKKSNSSLADPILSAGSVSGHMPRVTRGHMNVPDLDVKQSQPLSYSVASTQQMADAHGQHHGQPFEDDHADVLAALTFLETQDARKYSEDSPQPSSLAHVSPSPTGDSRDDFQSSVDGNAQYRSSFAPSKKASERLAKSQAQQAAHQAAVSRPGRSSARPKIRESGAWNESSDEEEDGDDDEDDDEDVDSDLEPAPPSRSVAHDRTSSANLGLPSGNIRPLSPYGPTADFAQRPPRHLSQPHPGQTGPSYG
jgi:CCR4-NOT transcriptional complex subunit CAF120